MIIMMIIYNNHDNINNAGYEPDLCKAVLAKGIGIFECEGFSVYSSEDMDLGTHEATGASVATVNIGGSLKVEYGGRPPDPTGKQNEGDGKWGMARCVKNEVQVFRMSQMTQS